MHQVGATGIEDEEEEKGEYPDLDWRETEKKKNKRGTQDAEIRTDYLKSEVLPHDLTCCEFSLFFYNEFQCLETMFRAGI
jgi:hypothetical protein